MTSRSLEVGAGTGCKPAGHHGRASYVFAGTDSREPACARRRVDHFVRLLYANGLAVAGLVPNGAAATAASTLAVASSDAAGVTPFSGPPGQVPSRDVGDGGAHTGRRAGECEHACGVGRRLDDGFLHPRYPAQPRDRRQPLEQSGQRRGFGALVQDTGASLSGAIAALGTEQGALGDIQASLASRKTRRLMQARPCVRRRHRPRMLTSPRRSPTCRRCRRSLAPATS